MHSRRKLILGGLAALGALVTTPAQGAADYPACSLCNKRFKPNDFCVVEVGEVGLSRYVHLFCALEKKK